SRARVAGGAAARTAAHTGPQLIDPTRISPLPPDSIMRPAYADQQVFTENAVLPGTLSPVITGGLLRRELGFDGIVVTDALDMSGLTIYFRQEEAGGRRGPPRGHVV